MAKNPAFLLDLQTCTGCKTCMIACKDKNDLPLGVRWRRVVEFSGGDWVRREDGTFGQNVFAYYVSVSCNHCEEPICVQSCPTKAMQRDVHGIVSVDAAKCVGCRYCEWACPYSAPQYDETQRVMTKCDFCRDQLMEGGAPACVAGCPTRALRFGEMEELAAGPGSDLFIAPLPPPSLTKPRLFLEPHQDAKPGQTRTGGIGNPEEVKDA